MAKMKRIPLLLVDEHPAVLHSLALSISVFPDIAVVGQATSGDEAIEMSEKVHPSVVLMDALLPGRDAASVTREIRSRRPEIQVLLLASFQNLSVAGEALCEGAIDFILEEEASIDQLAEAIRDAHAGRPS
jgi:DNA-binding NarL/FixJ family response regulator